MVRTGDLRSIDADGFLTVLGRVTEFINRGGEKIAPYTVERALLLHPCVRDATAFSVPHPRLGENVAAAVVLSPGANTTPGEIKAFLTDHLSSIEIPQRVFVKTELPRGPTGKIMRRQLSNEAAQYKKDVMPAWSPLQVEILRIWTRLTGRSDLGIDDDFIEAGGDSLLCVQMICEVETIARCKLPPSSLRGVYTIRELEAAIMRDVPANADLMTFAKEGSGPPFLFCHGDFQCRGLYAFNLADKLTCEQPVYLLHPHLDPDPTLTIEDMARAYIPRVLTVQPAGPVRIGGFCNGGYIAWEIANQLSALGREIELVVLFNTASLVARRPLRALAKLIKVTVPLAPKKIRAKIVRDGMSSIWSRVASLS